VIDQWIPASSLPGIGWPAPPSATTATILALAWQLDRSQWWPPAVMRQAQDYQLARLLEHAARTVAHYRAIDPRDFTSVPILRAIDAQKVDLRSTQYPKSHGRRGEAKTRSDGRPYVEGNDVIASLWHAVMLREHGWHQRDPRQRTCSIRHTVNAGVVAKAPDGVRSIDPLLGAPVSALSMQHSTIDEQVAWLLREKPRYIITLPTVLHAILGRLRPGQLEDIAQVRTISEVLEPSTRSLCREVLGAPIVDTYSAQEVGYIALQCPQHEHYHVVSERLLVEILGDDGKPCRAGEQGRVVITDLHNFATPLLRYDIGDYAEIGEACSCGRGLPVLKRVLGRARNLLVYPDGRMIWPVYGLACRKVARFATTQLVQTAIDKLQLRVVPDGPVDIPALAGAVKRVLGDVFDVEVVAVAKIERSRSGKLEDFISKVSETPRMTGAF
jgi:phenylacetate-CoA ligase